MTWPMEGYDARTYGERIAGIYDELYGELFDDEAAIARLAPLVGGGRALELAVGTGRIAVPLKHRPGLKARSSVPHMGMPGGLHDPPAHFHPTGDQR